MKKHVLTLAICSILSTGVFAAEGSGAANANAQAETNMSAEASTRNGVSEFFNVATIWVARIGCSFSA